jgi:hypothetical protein
MVMKHHDTSDFPYYSLKDYIIPLYEKHLSTNNCTIEVNYHLKLPYICFGHHMTIIRGIYPPIYNTPDDGHVVTETYVG